jgi:hypothetical protein
MPIGTFQNVLSAEIFSVGNIEVKDTPVLSDQAQMAWKD